MHYQTLQARFEPIINVYVSQISSPLKVSFISEPWPGYSDASATAGFENGSYVIDLVRARFEHLPFKRAAWILLHEIGHVVKGHVPTQDTRQYISDADRQQQREQIVVNIASSEGVDLKALQGQRDRFEQEREAEASAFADAELKRWQPYVDVVTANANLY